ncbi:MAG TPA: branched-chain amino acid ABC transporter substrate-binding protein [Acidimicrobiales bacterium]|nr:branched-chain amino acid ABC transporter substrate-binding protein [Acidimicrobiales bacterium]
MHLSKSLIWRLLALLAATTLLLGACTDSNDDTNDSTDTTSGDKDLKPIKLAFVGPLTGSAANLGINIRNGIKVALDEAKKEGLDITLEEFDTEGDPAKAPTVKDQYINDEEIVGIIGPTFSGETKAVVQAYEEAGVVMVSASATNAALPTVVNDGASFHRIIPDDDVQGDGLAGFLATGLNAKTVAYVDDNTDYGKGLADGTRKLMESKGVKTAVTDHVDPKSQDFSAAVNKVKAAKPDVVFYGGYYTEAGRLKKQLVDAKATATFVSGDGALDPGFIKSGGAGAEGALLTCPCNLATKDGEGGLASFASAYEKLNTAAPGTYSTEGYDVAKLYIDLYKKGADTRKEMLAGVEGLDSFEGLSKTIEFYDNGNVKAGEVFVFEVKGGKIVLKGTAKELSKKSGTSGTSSGGSSTTSQGTTGSSTTARADSTTSTTAA